MSLKMAVQLGFNFYSFFMSHFVSLLVFQTGSYYMNGERGLEENFTHTKIDGDNFPLCFLVMCAKKITSMLRSRLDFTTEFLLFTVLFTVTTQVRRRPLGNLGSLRSHEASAVSHSSVSSSYPSKCFLTGSRLYCLFPLAGHA